MKATTWLCPVLTLLCATKLVYTAQRDISYGGYPAIDGLGSNLLQNDYILAKRNKPSLSIVNPLDVLRQRLLLEIARRQMKENTRQVELNRAILKNVGKRMLNKHPYPLDSSATQWDSMQQQKQQRHISSSLDGQQEMHLQPYDLELIPSTLIFDYLQQRRPWSPANAAYDIYDSDNADMMADVEPELEMDAADVAMLGLGALQSMNGHKAEYDGQHKTTMKKPINRSGLESTAADVGAGRSSSSSSSISNDGKVNILENAKHHKTFNNDYKLNDLTTLELNEAAAAMGKGNSNSNNSENIKNMDNDDYQVQRYLYHLHKNHLTRK